MRRRIRQFCLAEEGMAAIEFVAAMLFFTVLSFFAFEVGVAVFWNATAEKAAQIGARLAIVGDPAVTNQACPIGNNGQNEGNPVPAGVMPITNCRNGDAGGIYGRPCNLGHCRSWGPVICVGGTSANCDADAFAIIAQRVQSVFGLATDDTITVRYEDTGLGYAGGPVIPMVTVEISGLDYDLLFSEVLGLMTRTGTDPAGATMPTVSATLTGEDLSVDS